MRIAIMQPYFFPYVGYFRLFAATDLFVVLDDVQFPRRGWVHRNRLRNMAGEPTWFTLPLTKTPHDAIIAAQRFRDDAEPALRDQARRFPVLSTESAADHELSRLLFHCDGPLVEYLMRQLTSVCGLFELATPMVRASSVDVDPALRAADRLIAVAREFNADTYVNAPGGRGLYDRETFSREGLDLRFLADHEGSSQSVLERALSEPTAQLREEIVGQCRLV